MNRRILAIVAIAAMATGCAGMSRNERAGTAGVTGAGAVATGVLLISSRSGCSGNSEDPDACTFGDHGRDLAVTVGGGLVLASGAVLLGAMIYLLSR